MTTTTYCGTCGLPDGDHYAICPESTDYYSPERERADSDAHDAMSHSEWFAQGMRAMGEADGLADDNDLDYGDPGDTDDDEGTVA